MTQATPIPTCPMAATCKGMMEKPGSSFWMFIPGLMFVVIGVLIILYPQILTWLVAIALIAMGVAMLMMVNFMRGIGQRAQNRPG